MGKRQHYIPQFYLRFFSEDNKTVSIFLFLKKLYRRNVPIKSIMYKPSLYDNDDSKEQVISHLESQWNISLKKIIKCFGASPSADTKYVIDKVDLLNLYSFVCFTFMRTCQQINAIEFQSQAFIRDLQERFPEIDPSGVDALKPLHDPYFEANMALDGGVTLLPYFLDLVPVFLLNTTTRSFISSDAPITPFNPFFEEIGYLGDTGLGNCGLQIYCPLSPKIAVIFYDSDIYRFEGVDYPIVQTIESLADVRALNGLIVDHSYEVIVMPPSYPQCEIKGLCKDKKRSFSGVALDICETSNKSNPILYCSHFVQIKSNYVLPRMKIAPTASMIKFPNNSAGPLRSSVRALVDNRKLDAAVPSSDEKPFVSTRIGTYTPEGFVKASPYNGPKGYYIDPGGPIE